jgi:hypothetical protein
MLRKRLDSFNVIGQLLSIIFTLTLITDEFKEARVMGELHLRDLLVLF